MREKIAKIIFRGEMDGTPPAIRADQIISLLAEEMPLRVDGKPLAVEEYPEVIKEMVEFINIWAVNSECDCSRCSPGIKVLTYNGHKLELAEVRE